MTEKKERAQIHSRLRAAGIPHTLDELHDDPRIAPDGAAQLLELLKTPYSLDARTFIVSAMFARKPTRAQKREAVDVMLKLLREHRGSDDPCLSSFTVNWLASGIEARHASEIIQMTLDPRYGLLRTSFTYVLYRLNTPEAIACLRTMTKDPVVASSALYKLARLNVDGVAELCDAALKIPGVQYTDTIKQTRAKLKRQLAKKVPCPSHVTTDPIPKGLAEWSTNLDSDELHKALRRIAKCIPTGFGKAEVAEVQFAAERLAVGQDVRLRFNVKLNRAPSTVWLEVFCDDEEDYDLAVFGDTKLIERLDGGARPAG